MLSDGRFPYSAPASRRAFLHRVGRWGAGLAFTTATSSLWPPLPVWAQGTADTLRERFIVRSINPEDFETRVERLDSWITANDLLFVRSHMYTPNVVLKNWSLRVDGEVERPLILTFDRLKEFGEFTVPVTLECTGNGRSFYEPHVPGVQWGKGAVGNARWTGVRLADVLKKAGVKPTGRHVIVDGADVPIGKMPDFIRSVPIEKALHPATMLAYRMNDAPLAPSHGFPLRLVVPGWGGASWTKWVTRITVSPTESDNFFMQTAYRYPTKPVAPGAAVDPKDMAPVTEMEVKSLIAKPSEGAQLPSGPIKVTGFAWAGEADVTRVDVSTDLGRSWNAARLGKDQARYAWRAWEYTFTAKSRGAVTILSRATDSRGRIQPIVPAWNPSGYLWNVVDKVRVNIT